jgi:subtilisin family serine protease
MSRRIVLLTALSVALATLVAVPAQAGGGPGADRYIVVLKDAVDSSAVANLHAQRYGANVDAVWSHALRGYAAVIPNDRVAALRADENVSYVVADGVATTQAQTIPWGITKIGAAGKASVANVHVYVIDTGVETTHPDLNVRSFVSFANGPNKDCNGHGTHVAGTIAAINNTVGVVGVAAGAPIHAVKVLGCSGSGSWTGVISGIDWVTANAIKPAIANMSLGGSANKAVDDAVTRSAASGVFYSLAAGNDGGNACNQSPARAGAGTNNGIATVAATDSNDQEASWSNYGSCVDIWAPGVSIYSTYKGGGYATLSGTSMASPHVGGGGALYLSSHTSASPSSVEGALRSAAQTPGTKSKDGRNILREYVGGF